MLLVSLLFLLAGVAVPLCTLAAKLSPDVIKVLAAMVMSPVAFVEKTGSKADMTLRRVRSSRRSSPGL